MTSLDHAGVGNTNEEAEHLFRLYLDRLVINLARVEQLVKYAEASPPGNQDGRFAELPSELLRTAVVLLHSLLEDLLRYAGELRLPDCGKDVLDNVPLLGSRSQHAEKFYLGRLSDHRDKTVQQLIRESVQAQLARTTFNSTDDVACWLRTIGVPISPSTSAVFPVLATLMARRHAIVHSADCIDGPDGKRRIDPIDASTVKDWQDAVLTTSVALATSLFNIKADLEPLA
jgi:hypothetical protein